MVLVALACASALFAGFVLYMSWKKRTIMALLRQMQLSGTTFVLGPEIGSYRGATALYGRVKCDGIIALTDTFLLFAPFIGKKKEIPLKDFQRVDVTDKFLGQYRMGMQVLVLRAETCEVGFFVNDINRWQTTLTCYMRKIREVS
ncbi:hypothetical protein JXB22_10700 [candidate division WOR-3 bacterium]|nr:hypothetical protein [candidate division WOR-3 bacterium]